MENIRGVLDPLADIKVFFEVINTSRFNFTVRDLTVKIYNKNTSEFLTENRVKTTMYIPIGVSTHNVELLDNRIVGDINSFLNGETKYLAIISFRFLGVKIEFEQLIEL